MANEKEQRYNVSLNRNRATITFFEGNEGRPETSETTGNVTVNNMAIGPKPSFFEVSFTMSATLDVSGTSALSTLDVRVPVPLESDKQHYSDVEAAAMKSLPKMLRVIAELIEDGEKERLDK